jgi:tRNA(Ile)-lysidine synthase
MVAKDLFMLLQKVKKTIKKHKLFSPGDKVVIGVSGGPDSVCLLHLLCAMRFKLRAKLIVAHLNHCLRGEDSDRDEKFVKELAEKMNLLFFSKKLNLAKKKGNLEEIARQVRYEFLAKVARQYKTDKIATAHTACDQIETVLMNIFRGAGPRGLCGMRYISLQTTDYRLRSSCRLCAVDRRQDTVDCRPIKIIRPLLDIWRSEIEEYLNQNKIPYRIDKSNFDLRFTRNRIRHKLIPVLEKENSQFKKMFFKKIKKFQKKYEDILEKAGKELSVIRYPLSDREITLDLNKFKKFNPFLQSEILRLAIEELTGDLKNITEVNIKQCLKLIKSGKTGLQLHLPKRLKIFKDYGKIVISLQHTDYSLQPIKKKILQIPGITAIPEINRKIKTTILKKAVVRRQLAVDSNVAFLDYDKCGKKLYIRAWQKGDRFSPLGMRGTKKLQDFFTDCKISRRFRNQIPIIVTENDQIVWIAGFQIDNRFKLTDKTEKILKLELKSTSSGQ